jgi:hypothetical protein
VLRTIPWRGLLFVNLKPPLEDELAPLAAITPNGNGNGNGSYAGSCLS